MSTKCIETFMEEPLEVLKGCSCILGELNSAFVDDDYADIAIDLISCLMRDAVSIMDDKERGVTDE